MKESNCWCCRGFGHTRTTCPSTDATRSLSHALQALSSISERQSKSGGKGKAKGAQGRGAGGGRAGRPATGRGSGTIATYLEDGHIWTMDGAYVASTPATYENEETDEEAHTAMSRNADDDSDYEDGDGWLDEFDTVTLDSANVTDVTSPFDNDENTSVSSLEDDGNSSDSSSDYAQVVDYNNCESDSESEDNENRATLTIDLQRRQATHCG